MAPRELQGAATDGAGDGAEPAQGRRGGRGRCSSISPAPQLRPPMEPRRAALGSVHPWSSAAGLAGLRRAGGGQARRPPSPSPAPPPSRAPAVALFSPSSSVRGRGAATLPCSLGGERGQRSAAGRRGGDLYICPALATGPVHVRSDVAVHVGGQHWSETFWTSIDTLK